jgi:hypothetical protein
MKDIDRNNITRKTVIGKQLKDLKMFSSRHSGGVLIIGDDIKTL